MNNKVKIEFDRYELGTLLNALREFRNIKIREDIATDSIDELLIRLLDIYEKRCPLMKALKRDYGR